MHTEKDLRVCLWPLTHCALLDERLFVFEGVVGELGAVVCRSVTVITGSIKRDRAVTCQRENQSHSQLICPPVPGNGFTKTSIVHDTAGTGLNGTSLITLQTEQHYYLSSICFFICL